MIVKTFRKLYNLFGLLSMFNSQLYPILEIEILKEIAQKLFSTNLENFPQIFIQLCTLKKHWKHNLFHGYYELVFIIIIIDLT